MFNGANVSTHVHSIESRTSSRRGARPGRRLVGDPASDLISKAKKKNDNIFYHSSAHKSHAVTCSLCNLLYIYFWHGAIFYFIFSPIRRVYLSGGSLELFGDDDRSYLQKRRAVEETFRELVRRDSFPIINNNPPHFLFRLSDVCISFVFFNWRSLIKPSP